VYGMGEMLPFVETWPVLPAMGMTLREPVTST
jgi:hypothetical protein